MGRVILLAAGFASLGLGLVGIVVPLLPTVPFVLLAAFCFGGSSPRLERWLLEHKHYGPHIRAWRTSRSISRSGKKAAWAAFAVSAIIGLLTLPPWWNLVPAAAGFIGSLFIARLPTTPESGAP